MSHGIPRADATKNASVAIFGRRRVDASAGPAVELRLSDDRKLGCSNSAVPSPLRRASYVSLPIGSLANADRPPLVTYPFSSSFSGFVFVMMNSGLLRMSSMLEACVASPKTHQSFYIKE
jgi:hypothetical protein